MADGLFQLYKLHLIDSVLYETKQRAAALDVGQAESKRVKELESDPDGTLARAKALSAELKDLELQQKSLEDKLKKLDSDLYGGQVVNPREVENIEKEKAHVRALTGDIDARILELWDALPPVKEAAAAIEREVADLKQTILKKHGVAKQEHERLQAKYRSEAAKRPEALKAVPAALLAQYEKLREKLGVGMALLTDLNNCSACGMPVSEKGIEHIRHDNVTPCENCRRILYRHQQE